MPRTDTEIRGLGKGGRPLGAAGTTPVSESERNGEWRETDGGDGGGDNILNPPRSEQSKESLVRHPESPSASCPSEDSLSEHKTSIANCDLRDELYLSEHWLDDGANGERDVPTLGHIDPIEARRDWESTEHRVTECRDEKDGVDVSLGLKLRGDPSNRMDVRQRWATFDQLKTHDTQGPNVCFVIIARLENDFRCHPIAAFN